MVPILSLICVSQTLIFFLFIPTKIKTSKTFIINTYSFRSTQMVMPNEKNHIFKHDHHHGYDHDLKNEYEKQYPCSSIEEASTISNGSSSSLSCSSSSSTFDTTDDASSANSSGSSLYDLSDLMSHLPIKKGLSKFYNGKSDSFTSLARVTSIEDLPKKDKNTFKKMKYKSYTLPKPIITKKNSKRKKFGAVKLKKEPKE